jgi:hypothetical protein
VANKKQPSHEGLELITLDADTVGKISSPKRAPDSSVVRFSWYESDFLLQRCNLQYAFIFNGLRAILKIARDDEGKFICRARLPWLRCALLDFTRALNDVTFPFPKVWAAHTRVKTFQKLHAMLEASIRLEAYNFNFTRLSEQRRDQVCISLASCLKLSAQVIRRLGVLYGQSSDKPECKTIGKEIYGHILKMRRMQAGGWRDSKEWRAGRREVSRLEGRIADDLLEPTTIAAANGEWSIIESHAKDVASTLQTAFREALTSNPARIADKVAVGPESLLTALVQRVSHLPVFEGLDTHTMYQVYMTELVYPF